MMDFDKFCATICIAEEETKNFKNWLEKEKYNLMPRSLYNWFYLFNRFFDN